MPTDALISQQLRSLINGISRQPAVQRLESQAENQLNCLSDVSKGVTRRPPAEHIALAAGHLASGVPTEGFFTHVIDLGINGQYLLFIEDGDINVYDLADGTEVTVNDSAAGTAGTYDYLATSGATSRDSFAAVTVADATFIVNKTLPVAMSGVTSADRENAHEFLLFINTIAPTGNQNQVTVTIGGTGVSSTGTPTQTDALAGAVMNALTGGATGTDVVGTTHTNWRFTRLTDSNVLYGYQFQNALETVEVEDRYGDTLFNLFATGTAGEDPQAATFGDLPARGRDGFVVLVNGDDGADEGSFYVRYDDEEKVWKETVKPGLDDSFDADTMPHRLNYNAGAGDFTFTPATWADRTVGDTDSAPEPSFVGQRIKDVSFLQNRLMVCADENVVATESGEFFNFWPTTVSTVVDSDPFDVAGTSDHVALWEYLIPYNGNLTLFSPTGGVIGELVGDREGPLTVQNARILERGEWVHDNRKPAVVGDTIYYPLDRGDRSGVFAYRQVNIDTFRAEEITSHIGNYLPDSVQHLTASRTANILALQVPDEPMAIYVYRFWFLGQEQAMSSWSKWTFLGDDIVSADFIGPKLYLVIERQDGLHFEVLDFGKASEDANLDFRVHLDSLVELTGVYAVGPDETTWTIPYDQATNGGTYRVITSGDWGDDKGRQITVKDASVDLSITATGDWSTHSVYIGAEYESTYELSEIVVRNRNTQSSAGALASGRLQLRKGRVVYEDSGTFDVNVTSTEDSDTYAVTFTSQYVNQAILGPITLADGVFDFDIGGHSRNVRIAFTSLSFLPFTLAAIDWEGWFYQRSN